MVTLTTLALALATSAALSSAAPSLPTSLQRRNIQLGEPDGAPNGYEVYTSPIVVPAPNVTGAGDWSDAVAKAQQFVSLLTVEELVNLTTGAGITNRCVGNTGEVTRLGFGGLCLQDGPLGVRLTDFVSAFPAGINAATTWDKQLIRKRGVAMGSEFRAKGVNVALSPMMNMGRVAAGGRNWEGFGAEPFLTGVCASETIKGIQSNGVIACAKHFVGNEQEHYRGGSGGIASSSNIDDRTMHEVYSWPFAESVRAGVGSVMCSYQRVNQTFACENSKTINGILKGELDYQGFVVSDWAAAVSGVNSALAGLDMNMPGFFAYGDESQDNPVLSNTSYWGAALLTAVNNGSVPLTRLQDMVTRTMSAYYKMGQDDPNYPKVNFDQYKPDTYIDGVLLNEHVDVQGNHGDLIRQIGAASTVLLKNDNGSLPLVATSIQRLGIFGSDAGPNVDGPNACGDRGCDQGTLAQGWGSGSVNYPHLIDPLSAIQAYFKDSNPNAVVEGVLNDFNYVAATAVARQADQCIVFVNANSGEGYITVDTNAGDRNNLTLWHEGDTLIKNVTSQCNDTVVVVHAVGPVILEAWVENPNVTAILWAGLPGQESGHAIVDVLFGAVNPSGRLPYTIAKDRADYGADILYASHEEVPQIDYTEALLIDYRWFDAKNVTPRYEFGHGLSYTTFDYSSLTVSALSSSTPSDQYSAWMNPSSVVGTSPGGSSTLFEDIIAVSFTVINSGGVAGHEVSQVYLGFPDSAGEPPKVLRGFERTHLESGESANLFITLNRKAFSIWDVVAQHWVIPHGQFTIYVGKSSRQIELSTGFYL